MIRHAIGLSCLIAAFSMAACGSSPSGTDGGPSTPTTDAGPLMVTDAYSAADPYSAARAACIAEINRLRATHGLPAYTAWTGVEACVDGQATSDETSHMPHGRWASNVDSCNGNGQNECLGQGADGIVQCLDSMWAEGEQAECAGCDACSEYYNASCPNCDFSGQATGHVCGHYVNMSAHYLTMAACGFSSLGGWDVINFH